MSNLLPEKWSEALERVHDKVGHFLNKLNPLKKMFKHRNGSQPTPCQPSCSLVVRCSTCTKQLMN